MSRIIEQINAESRANTTVAIYRPGDVVRVHVKIKEGSKERIQVFEGTVIARRDAGPMSTVTVRKVSYGVGVERIFPICSPTIAQFEWVRRGRVRRAKLYYLRDLRGKKARLSEVRSASAPESR